MVQFRNEDLIKTLPAAEGKGYVPAYLLDRDRKVLYTFLYNPEGLEYSRTLNHATLTTALASMSAMQFTGAGGGKMTFSDLKLEARDRTTSTPGQPPTIRSILSQLRGIESLAIADVPNGKFSPTEVYFSWGSFSFGPAYIVDSIDYRLIRMPGGEPTEARLSFTLQEIPPVLLDTVNQRQFETDYNRQLERERQLNEDAEAEEANQQAVENASNSTGTTEQSSDNPDAETILSLRQQDDGREAAAVWLRQNITSLTSDVRRLYRTGDFTLEVAESGTVTFNDGDGNQRATLGTYDGSNFIAGFSETNSTLGGFRTTR